MIWKHHLGEEMLKMKDLEGQLSGRAALGVGCGPRVVLETNWLRDIGPTWKEERTHITGHAWGPQLVLQRRQVRLLRACRASRNGSAATPERVRHQTRRDPSGPFAPPRRPRVGPKVAPWVARIGGDGLGVWSLCVWFGSLAGSREVSQLRFLEVKREGIRTA